jgi:hypothetical protein
MVKKKCELDKPKKLKPEHKFECRRCGNTSKKKEKLCKPDKLDLK